MAEINFNTALSDVKMNPESSPLYMNTTTTNTTQLHRSSRQAAKKSGLNATPSVSSDAAQLDQPEGSKKDPPAGSNSTRLDVEMEPLHRWIEIIEPVQLQHVYKKTREAALNKPSSFYLSDERKEDYLKICVPLQTAALRGDWHAAEEILGKYPKVVNMSITHGEDTVLHIVASTKHTYFAEKLVTKMEAEDLKLQNRREETALWLAVASTKKMVDILLKRNKGLLKVRTMGSLPLMCAVRSGHKDIVDCIYLRTDIAVEQWKESDKIMILNSCIAEGLHDIALRIFNHCKIEGTQIAVSTETLRYLAYRSAELDRKPGLSVRRRFYTILPGPRLGTIDNCTGVEIIRNIWEEIIKQKHDDILKTIAGDSKTEKGEGVLFLAARLGNYRFIIELLKLYPEIAWDQVSDGNKYTIFHIAVINRHESVYNLLYELGSKKLETLDRNRNNILHLAAMKPQQSRLNIVSGAALQMQRELLWFKEVKTRVSSIDGRKWNKDGKSPQVLFTEQHVDMVKEGEIWMKHNAAQCMVVAALIATIMFAAAFTLPGGNNGDDGHPLFLRKSAFIVFVVADAISLCTSSASLLTFLAILTARYTEDDFFVSLPWKLMIGLLTLFISIATMMVTFSASFFLLYAEKMRWIPVLVSTLAGVPVILFSLLQSRLFFDVVNSTFNSRHLFGPKKLMM